jgi:NhaP-type Na+/H+ or K+/H+ antiporter
MQETIEHGTISFALAMAIGMLCQGIARHLSMPGIVVLLAAGVLLGPDVANVIRPQALGPALPAIVGFSVAIILFEGGLNLKLKVLREQARAIRRLVFWGAVITGVGGTLAARLCLGWDWPMSILLGSLVIVTGPTVITPLLRRIRVEHDISTILEAEGLFIDAVGATIAIVTLEIVIARFSSEALGAGLLGIAARLGVGVLVGLAGGLLLVLMLRGRRLVPEGLENVLVLSFVVALFAISNALVPESGITAAIVAGMAMGNLRSRTLADLVAFKEQLTVLLIATLFVLLAADVRVADVLALGWPGLLTVAVLIFVVRPLDVWICTRDSGLGWRKMMFLAWLAPRGIVAAAVASLFAIELERAGFEGGTQLKALVFLVIATTVTVQGLSGNLVARLLQVQRTGRNGFLILGANPLAILVAQVLRDSGARATLVDTNVEGCRQAERAGLEVINGNGLEEETLARAQADSREACVAATSNESVNYVFAQKIRRHFAGPAVYVALQARDSGVSRDLIDALDAHTLFGGERDLYEWTDVVRREQHVLLRGRYADSNKAPLRFEPETGTMFLPIAGIRQGKPFLLTAMEQLVAGDEVVFAIDGEHEAAARAWLADAGFAVAPAAPVAPAASVAPVA